MHPLLHKQKRKWSGLMIGILLSTCLWQLATAGWIQGKAIIAQQLLDHSWNQMRIDPALQDKPWLNKPWPWADTWPVAKLLVPQYDIEQIVLAGDSGSSLAFGPGYSFAGAEPNTTGTAMISAHRDTHFRFLKKIKPGDTIILQTTKKTIHYKVDSLNIVDSKTYRLQSVSDRQTLVLVTCFPFEAITPGGSLRYLVFAHQQFI
ncbi:MAG: class GN sortase [Gammaproteobacteria bacterium]|nr:class GN sortase [Gammaproteobacteria bacterium]